MAVLVTSYLFMGFSLFFKCVSGMLRNFLGGGAFASMHTEGHIRNTILRSIMVIVVVLVGLAVPHFRDVMAIMSAVCCSCNNVFFPLLFAVKLENQSHPEGSPGVSQCRRLAHFGIFLLGIFCFCLGLWSSLGNLMKEMGHHFESTPAGYPANITRAMPTMVTTSLANVITATPATSPPYSATALVSTSGYFLTVSSVATTTFSGFSQRPDNNGYGDV